MKRLLMLFMLTMLFASLASAQSQTTFSITVVAPPSCTVTLASNPESTSGTKLYAGQAGVINFNISACAIASAQATATWDTTALVLTYTPAAGTTPASLSAAVTAAEATAGSHSLVLTIPLPILSMSNPVTFPNAKVGAAYTASLPTLTGLTGGVPPYNWSISGGSLPSGLSLSSNGNVSGIPSSAGTFNLAFTVVDSSGLAMLRFKVANGFLS